MSNERRKYYRTSLVLPIEVYSYACEHSRFYEYTQTLNVSPLGASFRLQNRVDVDDIVRLILPMPAQLRLYDQDQTQYQIYAQVRRVRNRGDGSFSVGVAFISKEAPDIEVSQPVFESEAESEPEPELEPKEDIRPQSVVSESEEVFLTRPLGPQGLVKNSLNSPNPLNTTQKSGLISSSSSVNNALQPNQSPQSMTTTPSSVVPPMPPVSSTNPRTISNIPNYADANASKINNLSPATTIPNQPKVNLPFESNNQSSKFSQPVKGSSVSLKHPTIAQHNLDNLNSERNEPRAKLRLSLSIRGLDKSGQYFVEVIQTEDVSKHGICFMLCKHELDVNTIVEIVGFQGKFHAQGEIKHINFNPVDRTYRIGLRLLGEPTNWIVK